jgi:hypothetical protein
MDYTNSPASNQHPNAHDYAQLSTIYAHVDSGAAAARLQADAPPAMEQLYLEGPEQWGRVVSRYEDGRPARYELDFGRGYKVITHVYWLPEEARK